MSNFSRYIKAQAASTPSNEWVRNPDWIAIPDITNGDNKMYGVMAVYENETNELTLRFGGGSCTIDWGDGTSTTTSNLVLYTNTYDYATTTTPSITDADGKNYKTILFEVNFSGTTTSIYLDRTSGQGGYDTKLLDLSIDCITANVIRYTNVKVSTKLERLRVYNHIVNNLNTTDRFLRSIRVFQYDVPLTGNYQNSFQYMGNALAPDGTPIDFTNSITSQANSTFTYATIQQIGNLSFSNATQLTGTFSLCTALTDVGTINVPSNTTFSSFFNNCISLKNVGTISTTSSLTSIRQMFLSCVSLLGVEITNCSGITDTVNAFYLCYNLRSLILTDITVGFDIRYSMLEADALDALFTSLGTANGSQTITITNNPGAATCDTTIATNKGYTIVS